MRNPAVKSRHLRTCCRNRDGDVNRLRRRASFGLVDAVSTAMVTDDLRDINEGLHGHVVMCRKCHDTV